MFKTKLYRVNPGSIDEWRAWCAEIQGPYSETARDTIREEGNELEGFLSFEAGGEWYALGFASGEFLAVNQKDGLNQQHSAKKRACLGEEIPLETLYFLDVKSEN